ncbi:MAG: PIN domain-containing protein [Candidatus Diapherotrites archaeon]|nr:PIN domain-containing protein [Candidatus Diapherotrites archaeon]
MTENRFLLDSKVWLGHFLEKDPQTAEVIESHSNYLYCSVLSIHEIITVLDKRKYSDAEILKALEFIRQNATIVDVIETTAINAAFERKKNSLPTVDSLIYATAIQEEAVLITADHHFEGLPQALII